jgi:hypothetical protein
MYKKVSMFKDNILMFYILIKFFYIILNNQNFNYYVIIFSRVEIANYWVKSIYVS